MNEKPVQIFECLCVDGFTGDFCEFKAEQNQLFYMYASFEDRFFVANGFVANVEGQLISESITFDDNVEGDGFCFTMLNGKAVIFGGYITRRQVKKSNC